MYRVESLQRVPVHLALVDEAWLTVQAASSTAESARGLLAAIVQPFSRLGLIEHLRPEVRARQSAREKALIDATLYGPYL